MQCNYWMIDTDINGFCQIMQVTLFNETVGQGEGCISWSIFLFVKHNFKNIKWRNHHLNTSMTSRFEAILPWSKYQGTSCSMVFHFGIIWKCFHIQNYRLRSDRPSCRLTAAVFNWTKQYQILFISSYLFLYNPLKLTWIR
jgi:hypothetical protein